MERNKSVTGPVPSFGEIAVEVLIEAFVADPTVEAFHEVVLHGLSWCYVIPTNTSVLARPQHSVESHFSSIFWANSEIILSGWLRLRIKSSSSRVTRAPDREQSTTVASASRVHSSTTPNTRNCWPFPKASDALMPPNLAFYL